MLLLLRKGTHPKGFDVWKLESEVRRKHPKKTYHTRNQKHHQLIQIYQVGVGRKYPIIYDRFIPHHPRWVFSPFFWTITVASQTNPPQRRRLTTPNAFTNSSTFGNGFTTCRFWVVVVVKLGGSHVCLTTINSNFLSSNKQKHELMHLFLFISPKPKPGSWR